MRASPGWWCPEKQGCLRQGGGGGRGGCMSHAALRAVADHDALESCLGGWRSVGGGTSTGCVGGMCVRGGLWAGAACPAGGRMHHPDLPVPHATAARHHGKITKDMPGMCRPCWFCVSCPTAVTTLAHDKCGYFWLHHAMHAYVTAARWRPASAWQCTLAGGTVYWLASAL